MAAKKPRMGKAKKMGGAAKNTRHMTGGDRKGPKKPRSY